MKPINGHVLIEPVARKHSVVVTARDTYEEIGVVVDFDETGIPIGGLAYTGSSILTVQPLLRKGDKVFFDSWLAAKYPKGTDEYYWLVRYEDIRAIENVIEQIPSEQPLSQQLSS